MTSNVTLFIVAETDLGLQVQKEIEISVPPPVEVEVPEEVIEKEENKTINETLEKNETKKEVPTYLKAITKQMNNTNPRFEGGIPSKITFDFDLGLESYEYISPKATDTEGDKIEMDFKGIEAYNFIVMRQKKDDSFLLVVEESLVETSMLGSYRVTVLLKDAYSKGPTTYAFDLVLDKNVEDEGSETL